MRLGHHVGSQFAGGGEDANVFQRGVRQCADGVEAQIAPDLEPNFRANVVGHRRFETSRFESVADGANARCVAAVNLTQCEAVAFNDFDHTRANHLTGGVNNTANHAVDGDVFGNVAVRVHRLHGLAQIGFGQFAWNFVKVPPRYAVLHGHHACACVHECGQIGSHSADLVRFERQNDHVLQAGFGNDRCGLDGLGDQLVAVFFNQGQTIGFDGFQIRAAQNQGDVVAS